MIHIKKGYSRDHRPELNQVVLNLIVENEAGIPLMMQAADGNQVDTKAFAAIVASSTKALQAAADSKQTLIADAAMYTGDGLKALKEKKLTFISRVPLRLGEAQTFLATPSEQFTPLDDAYACFKQEHSYGDIDQQWVVYKSLHATQRENKTIAKNLQKQSTTEAKAVRKVMQSAFYCEADANEALEALKQRCQCINIIQATLVQKPTFTKRGRPKQGAIPDKILYIWEIVTASHADLLREQIEEQSGRFILATNDMKLSPKELLDAYKSQQRVERGFRFLKSPEFLSDALFLKNPKRIEAMLMVMTLCLMVYAALEYTIRQELKAQDKTFPNQLGKPIQNPTTRWIFECFFAIHLLALPEHQQMIVGLNDRHRSILDLLGEHFWNFYRI